MRGDAAGDLSGQVFDDEVKGVIVRFARGRLLHPAPHRLAGLGEWDGVEPACHVVVLVPVEERLPVGWLDGAQAHALAPRDARLSLLSGVSTRGGQPAAKAAGQARR